MESARFTLEVRQNGKMVRREFSNESELLTKLDKLENGVDYTAHGPGWMQCSFKLSPEARKAWEQIPLRQPGVQRWFRPISSALCKSLVHNLRGNREPFV